MRYIILVLFFICMCANIAKADDFCNVKYISNYDGDTIRFDLGENLPHIFRFIPLRLYGIDTPEIKTSNKAEKKAALKAKKFVKSELTHAKTINLVNCAKDKYFRLNCRVEYDGKDLTNILLENNYGYEYYGGKKIKYSQQVNN